MRGGIKGEYETQKDLNWQLFYNLDALPKGFVPAEKLKDFMASAVTFSSGNASVYSPQTNYQEVLDPRDLEKLERKVRIIRRTLKFGQADISSMFEIKKKKKRESK